MGIRELGTRSISNRDPGTRSKSSRDSGTLVGTITKRHLNAIKDATTEDVTAIEEANNVNPYNSAVPFATEEITATGLAAKLAIPAPAMTAL